MKGCNIIYILLLAFGFSALSAQDKNNTDHYKPAQLKQIYKNALRDGDIYTAIDYLEKYCKTEKKDIQASYELAELYYQSRDYINAMYWYYTVVEADKAKYPMAMFYYAKMLKMTGKYNEALTWFNKFKKENKTIDKDDKERLKIEIEGCEYALDNINEEDAILKVRVTHLEEPVNKAHIEFSPTFIDDNTLLFGSLRADGIEYYKKDEPDKIPVRQFYTAKKNPLKWEFEGPFTEPINKPGVNTGNGAFTTDRKSFYFTRCEKNQQGKTICSIYLSKLVNERWTEPEMLDNNINSTTHTTTQPTLGWDNRKKENVLYFVSDRPGGNGGMDIWFSVYDSKKNEWKEPKNCGRKINTISDEVTPYYDDDSKTLYFSSDGHPGIGGLDIFNSNGEQSRWGEPENIGYPVNSNADDLYYVINKNKKEEGFFTSNRTGGQALKSATCCDDIYSFVWKDFRHVTLNGKLYDVDFVEFILEMDNDAQEKEFLLTDNTKYLIDSTRVVLFELKENGEENLIRIDTTDTQGNFNFVVEKDKNYKVVINKEGYFTKQHKFTTKWIQSDKLEQHVGLNAITFKPIIVKNIYYPFNESYLTEESKNIIDTTLFVILTENPQIIVELSSHTDNIGTPEYNIKLSQARAESVVKHLISKGISKERLSAKGYGETKPIAANENKDGSDNPDGRAKNRRTEFRITGILKNYKDIIQYEE